MEAQIKLGRIFGIQIGLHYSWLIIALLVVFSLGGHFQMMNPEWGAFSIVPVHKEQCSPPMRALIRRSPGFSDGSSLQKRSADSAVIVVLI